MLVHCEVVIRKSSTRNTQNSDVSCYMLLEWEWTCSALAQFQKQKTLLWFFSFQYFYDHKYVEYLFNILSMRSIDWQNTLTAIAHKCYSSIGLSLERKIDIITRHILQSFIAQSICREYPERQRYSILSEKGRPSDLAFDLLWSFVVVFVHSHRIR